MHTNNYSERDLLNLAAVVAKEDMIHSNAIVLHENDVIIREELEIEEVLDVFI